MPKAIHANHKPTPLGPPATAIQQGSRAIPRHSVGRPHLHHPHDRRWVRRERQGSWRIWRCGWGERVEGETSTTFEQASQLHLANRLQTQNASGNVFDAPGFNQRAQSKSPLSPDFAAPSNVSHKSPHTEFQEKGM